MDATTGYVSTGIVFLTKEDCPFNAFFALMRSVIVCCCTVLQGVTILERLKNLIYGHYAPKINREPETKLYCNRMHCDESDSSL